ncbi:hypothetical protein [Streptomyces sp. cmx-4-9]|uniref:hypothetical protein n=1 Tax=Streptomyces sp. cmx-4-9 TaxID=2790941 RepID=UPI00397FF3E1
MPTPEQIWEDADPVARRLAGVALNPSSPQDVLLRLLADGPPAVHMVLCRDRTLPAAVVRAVLRHPDPRTRAFFVRNPHVDPADRARLVDDPEWFVRAHLADGPRMPVGDLPRPLPDATVVHMIRTYDADLLGGTFDQQISPGLLRAMPTHPVAKVRCRGVGKWSRLPADTRAALLADADEEVREQARRRALSEDSARIEHELPDRLCHARWDILMYRGLGRAAVEGVLNAPLAEGERAAVAGNPSLPSDLVVLLSTDPDPAVREAVAGRADLGPADLVVLLSTDPDPAVREAVARRVDLGPAERRALAVDPDPEVRLALSLHPALTEAERAGIDYEVPVEDSFPVLCALRWPRDPQDVRRYADSGHPLLRRRAATERLLPADLVERLADDDDLGVRVLLAQHHPDAPARLLLRSFLEYEGPERARLTTRPNFPTAGLAAFADHDDPQVRALVARDPRAAPETVERLTRDPHPAVRAALARHPNLPRPRLTELLDDEELSHAAAANPAWEGEALRRMATPGR